MQNIDPCTNYENTAQAWAYHLDKPFPVDPHEVTLCIQLMGALWRDIHPETIETIQLDPLAFSDRVADYRYHLHANQFVEY